MVTAIMLAKTELALNYLKHGFSVIPLSPKSKIPPEGFKWSEFQNRRASEEEVKNWFLKNPDYNLGIVTGKISNLVVVDIEKDGETKGYTPTAMARSGGGGIHMYYRYPSVGKVECRNRFRELTDIRGDGGYAVAPPSIHAETGLFYEWIIPFDQISLIELPEELRKELAVNRKAQSGDLARIAQGVSDGERNEAAAKFIGHLLAKSKEHEWETEIWPKVIDWNLKNNPPLEEKELRTVFDSIGKREERGRKIKEKESYKAATQLFECERDGYRWSIKKGELSILRISDQKIVLSDTFGNAYFWKKHDNQEKIRKAIHRIGIYKDKKDAQRVTAEIFTEVRTCWKIEPVEEITKRKINERLKILISDREITLAEVHEKVSQIGVYPKELLDIIIAATISAQVRNKPPLWILIVGNPSSMKTEMVKLVDPLDGIYVYFLDSMTENAFASGYLPQDGSEPHDLLPALDGRCFVVKDYTTMFSLNEETLKKILGDMTSIFDEDFSKFSATRGNVSYKSLFSQIGCVTPSVINKHHRYMSQIGARFLSYRIPELDSESEEKGFEIAWSDKDRKQMIEEGRVITSSFCKQLIDKLPEARLEPEKKEIREKIRNLANFVRRARGIVISRPASFTDKNTGKEVRHYEIVDKQIEEPWRAFQQLLSLSRFLAITRGKQEVGSEEIETIRNVAIASMPVDRARALAAFKGKEMLETSELAEIAGISPKTAYRMLKELMALGIVTKVRKEDWKKAGAGAIASSYFPVSEFVDILVGESAEAEEVAAPALTYDEEDEIDANSLF